MLVLLGFDLKDAMHILIKKSFIKPKSIIYLMIEAIKQEILYDLSQAILIFEKKDPGDLQKLRTLSDHGIENVALYKDIDVITITVLLYSLYKISEGIQDKEYQQIYKGLKSAHDSLLKNKYGNYNRSIKFLFEQVKGCSARVKEHLQDVMQAARIKKGTKLLEKGLSMGQAAGLMGLSNWDLQSYASKTTVFNQHHEVRSAKKRIITALKIFGV